MVHYELESLIPLREVPNHLPRRRGRKVHMSTIYRWCKKGVHGVRLDTVRVGGITYTHDQALQRFLGTPKASAPPAAFADPSQLTAAKRARLRSLEERGC
jgi:hypothetical protein